MDLAIQSGLVDISGKTGFWVVGLGHLVAIAFALGAVCMIVGLISTVNAGFFEPIVDWGQIILGAGAALLGVLIVWAARRGERLIAKRCIAQYLLRRPAK